MAKQKLYDAFVVTKYKSNGEEKSHWTNVGAGFVNKDGQGISVVIREGISVHGTLVLRPPFEGDEGTGEPQQNA